MSDIQVNSESNYEGTYGSISDEELLHLSTEGGLTPKAEAALRTEMKRRSLGVEDVASMKEWERQQKLLRPRQRQFLGYGYTFEGEKFLSVEDKDNGISVATRFILIGYVPVIPTGSFRVVHTPEGFLRIVSTVGLQWDQVWPEIWPLLAVMLFILCLFFRSLFWDTRR